MSQTKAQLVGGVGFSTADSLTVHNGLAVTGVVTATSFAGNISGDATGLTGSPNITVTNITASGNVTVGGTLTYEDVTNIDAIGIVTARSGINITGAGMTVTGISTFRGDVQVADKIIHLDDSNTAIRFPAADTFTVETGGSERVRVDSDGKFLVGTTVTSSNQSGALNVFGTDGTTSFVSIRRGSNNASGSRLALCKSRNTTDGSNTIVQDDDILGTIHFYGNDGAGFEEGAAIAAVIDGTPGSNDLPTSLTFSTTPDGSATKVERLRITPAGLVRVPDSGKFTAGAGDDLQIYHDGSNSYLTNSTGQVYLGGSRVKLTNAAVTEVYVDCLENGRVDLMYDASVKLTTKTDGVDITGELQCDSLDVDGAADISSTLTLHNNLLMQDNDKIKLGSGNDLQIYHNGSHSFIADTSGTGNLYLNSNKVVITNAADTETLANFIENGAVELFYDASKKLATSSSGVTVTGTLNATTAVTQNGAALATNGKAVAMALVFG